MRKFFFFPVFVLMLSSCGSFLGRSSANRAPSESEISSGIREALTVGITKAVTNSSQANGFYSNPLIKIAFPPEAERAAQVLRDLGMGKTVDDFVETLNHGAEEATKKATPIFVNAIMDMNLKDVYGIWRGENDAATLYLKEKTNDQLKTAFHPVIKEALDKVEIAKYWKPIANTYNRIPFVSPVNPDLTDYVMQGTLDGLFYLLAQEETKIRENPKARVSGLLRHVFGWES
jgi:hypothetical protein